MGRFRSSQLILLSRERLLIERERERECVYLCVCCFVGADGCIPLTVLVDECQCCRLLMFICLPIFETLSIL